MLKKHQKSKNWIIEFNGWLCGTFSLWNMNTKAMSAEKHESFWSIYCIYTDDIDPRLFANDAYLKFIFLWKEV